MDNKFLVYHWTNNINKMGYVGITRFNKDVRFQGHMRSGSYFSRAIRKHGSENFSCEILVSDIETLKEALELEIKFIAELGTLYPDGYNLTKGGNGNHNQKGSLKDKSPRPSPGPLLEETKIKLSLALKGRIMTEEHKQKISAGNKGKTISAEHRKKLSEFRKTVVISEETRKKQSEAMKKRWANCHNSSLKRISE